VRERPGWCPIDSRARLRRPAAPAPAKGVLGWSTGTALTVMRIANFCNGLALGVLGVIIFLVPTEGSNEVSVRFDTLVLSGYVVFIGLVMCGIEIGLPSVQRWVRRRCGFMFSFMGRAVFILFAASLALALAW